MLTASSQRIVVITERNRWALCKHELWFHLPSPSTSINWNKGTGNQLEVPTWEEWYLAQKPFRSQRTSLPNCFLTPERWSYQQCHASSHCGSYRWYEFTYFHEWPRYTETITCHFPWSVGHPTQFISNFSTDMKSIGLAFSWVHRPIVWWAVSQAAFNSNGS